MEKKRPKEVEENMEALIPRKKPNKPDLVQMLENKFDGPAESIKKGLGLK